MVIIRPVSYRRMIGATVVNFISGNPTSSPGRFSLALGASPPKPGKSALGTRLVSTNPLVRP